MNTYKVEFCYIQDGRRVNELDVAMGDDAQEAVEQIRHKYSDCEDLQIESVWREYPDCWSRVETWD